MEGFFFKDTIVIFVIVILNGLLGYFQESWVEKVLVVLKKMVFFKVQVLWDGDCQEIKVVSLVLGDIILLEVGS